MKRNARIVLLLLFVTVQVLGVATAQHTNIHGNIWPVFGLLLLVPGIVLTLFLGITFWSIAISFLVNALAWYLSADGFANPKDDHWSFLSPWVNE